MRAKIANLISTFKNLPQKTQRLMGISMTVALVLALPVFIWGITSQSFTYLNHAASGEISGEPPTPTAIATETPGPTSASDACPAAEACPIASQPNMLSNCHPPQSDGTAALYECNRAGRIESCGPNGQKYCCPSTGGDWTTDTTLCGINPTPTAIPTTYPSMIPTPTAIPTMYPTPSPTATPIPATPRPPSKQCLKNEACPVHGQSNLLRSCHPEDSDGTTQDSLCNKAGRVETCGPAFTKYCCPKAGGAWTTNMSGCMTPPPTPMPISEGNPTISTAVLPIGILNRSYLGPVNAYEVGTGITLYINFSKLPMGLSNGGCVNGLGQNEAVVVCRIIGYPRVAGVHYINATVVDQIGKSSTRTLTLLVIPWF